MKSSFHIRRDKKLRRARPVTCFIAGLLLLGSVSWLYFPIRYYLDKKEQDRITNLDYPEPSVEIQNRLVFDQSSSNLRVNTNSIIIEPQPDGIMLSSELKIKLSAYILIYDPQFYYAPTIKLDLIASGSYRRSFDDWANTRFTLRSDEIVHLHLSSYDVDHDQTLRFEIPIIFLVNAINSESLSLSIDDHAYTLDTQTLDVLRDFAATLKPNYQPPTPD